MGVYVYSVRRKFVDATLSDGQTVRVWALMYHFKPWAVSMFDRVDRNRPYWAQISRMERVWAAKGESPAYVAVLHKKFEDGCEVRAWPGHISAYDTPRLPGTRLGFLKKARKTWVISTEEPQRDVCFTQENSLTGATKS